MLYFTAKKCASVGPISTNKEYGFARDYRLPKRCGTASSCENFTLLTFWITVIGVLMIIIKGSAGFEIIRYWYYWSSAF